MTDTPRPRLKIDEPCPKRWAEMTGSGTRRFCDQCSLHVVDGSALTRNEAQELVRSSEERVCMRLEIGADGKPRHADDAPPAAERESTRRRVLKFGLGFAATVLAACTGRERTGEAQPTGTVETPRDVLPGAVGPTEPAQPERMGAAVELLGDVACEPPIEELGEAASEGNTPEMMGKMIVTHEDPPEVLGSVVCQDPPSGDQ